MASNFEELYNELSSNGTFNAYFNNKEEFQKFVSENPNANEFMNEAFDVDINSLKEAELKKKENGEDFISNSPLVGQTQNKSENMVGSEGVENGTPNPPVKKIDLSPKPVVGSLNISTREQRGSDVPTYGTSRIEIESRQKARQAQIQKDLEKRQGTISASEPGTFGPQIKWPEHLSGLKDEFDGFIQNREKLKSGIFNNQSDQDNTENILDIYNNKIIQNPEIKAKIDDISSTIQDNFKNEKEVTGEGVFMKRDRDGYLVANPAYINSKVDEYFSKNPVFGEDAQEYKNTLKEMISVNLMGKYNAEVLDKVVTSRIGEFQPEGPEDFVKKFKTEVSKYDQDFQKSIEIQKQSLLAPIENFVNEKKDFYDAQFASIQTAYNDGSINEEEAKFQINQLQGELSSADAQRMSMVADATTRLNKFIEDKKAERSLKIDEFGEQLESNLSKEQKIKYDEYKKKYNDEVKKYNEEQANANALYLRGLPGGYDSNAASFIWDSTQSAISNMLVSTMKISGLDNSDIPWVRSIVDNLSKTVVGNQYVGRNMTDSKGIVEAIGAISNQLIEQVPNIAASIAVSALTKNPLMTTAFMMYTDMAREANDAMNSIINAGGNVAQAEIAKNNIANVHLLMTPLYFGQGSLLTEGLTRPGKNFLSNYARATFAENLFEIPQEYIQNYTSLKETGSSEVKNADGTFKSFGAWISTADQGKLALEVLPTTMLMGISPSVTSTTAYRKTEENYAAVGKLLGEKQLTQYVSDMYNLMGANVAMVIPDHLRLSGQINDQEYADLKTKFASYVQKLDEVQKAGVMDLNKSRLFLYKNRELEKLNQEIQGVSDPLIKKALEKKANGITSLLENIVAGNDVDLVTFKYANGSSFVLTEQDAKDLLMSKGSNAIQNALVNETRNRKGEAVNILSMETNNADLNNRLNELQKEFESKKEFVGVFGLEQNKDFNSVLASDLGMLEAMGNELGVTDIQLRLQEAKAAQDFLNQRLPGVNIEFLSDKDYKALMNKNGGNTQSNGNFTYVYDPKTKTYKASIQINLEKANSRTIAHETTHALLLSQFGEDALKFEDFKNNIRKFISESRDEVLNKFVSSYDTTEKADEYLSELAGVVANNEENLSKDFLSKIAEYINNFVSDITGGKIVPFKNVQNSLEVLDFFKSLTDSLSPKNLNQNAVQEQSTGQVPVQPETGTSQEVEQGESQAEPQGVTEEGQNQEEVNTTLEKPTQQIEKNAENQLKTKSQLDFTQIPTEFQDQLNNGISELDIYKNLISKGYPYTELKNRLPAPFWANGSYYNQAVGEMAKDAIELFGEKRLEREQQIADLLLGNYMMPLEEQYKMLLEAEADFSPLEIFKAFNDLRFATPEEMENLFGLEYRETVKNAISEFADPDFTIGMEEDLETRKLSSANGANDLSNVFIEAGLAFADASVMVDYFTNFLEENGLVEAAKELRTNLTGIENNPNALRQHFINFSGLMSMSGRLLQMARGLFKKTMADVINTSLEKNGIVLTQKQKETLARLISDYNAAQETYVKATEALSKDFSDSVFRDYFQSQKNLGLANISLSKFINDRKPTFWNDIVTSGGSRALLGIPTVTLSFLANVENTTYSTNIVTRGIQKLRDSLGGIQSTTLSPKNWFLAFQLTRKKSAFDVMNVVKHGNIENVSQMEKYFDGVAQINFFKDAKISADFVMNVIGKMTGKSPLLMTDEEFADAYNQTLIQLKNEEPELRDGKTYTIARSLFRTLSIGPQLTELTGRSMAFGGDIPFAAVATQRAIIDYLNGVQGTKFQNGMFESMLSQNPKLKTEALRSLSALIMADTDLSQPFVNEGLKRVLYGENPVSKLFSLLRGGTRKTIPEFYKKYRYEKSDKFTKYTNLAAMRIAQVTDVATWTLMPFLKVPINFLGVAMAKTIPQVSLPKWMFSEIMYRRELMKFNKISERNKGKLPRTENGLKEYEKAKINLFLKKRQATFDFAQMATSSAIYFFVKTAIESGALLPAGDPEEEKELQVIEQKGNVYNMSVHMEYLRNLFSGKDTKYTLAKRGGFNKEGDVIMNTNNLGFIGFGLNVWGSVFNKKREQEQGGIFDLVGEEASTGMLLFNETFNTGVQALPMLQGITRVADLFKEDKDNKKGEKFWAGTISTSLSLFTPSITGFISKGNGEIVQSVNDINGAYEDAPFGTLGIRVIQKLNRNVSFLVKNDYYKAMIGPYGEDLLMKNTVGEPGTAGAYAQALFDPFTFRTYGYSSMAAKKENLRYVATLKTNVYLANMLLIYRELTGRDYAINPTEKDSSMWTILSNPRKNEFAYISSNNTVNSSTSMTSRRFDFSLPNDLFRAEMVKRGDLRLNAMQKYLGDLEMGTPGTFESKMDEITANVKLNEIKIATELIEKVFTQFNLDLQTVNANYEADFNRRAPQIIKDMFKKNMFSEEKVKQAIDMGLLNKNDLIEMKYSKSQIESLIPE